MPVSLSPLQLRRERKPSGPAAGAAHGDEDRLLLLVGEVGALQHDRGLLLEQLVQRQIAGEDLVVGPQGGDVRRCCAGFAFRHGFLLTRHTRA
jgi:hypothetical protein